MVGYFLILSIKLRQGNATRRDFPNPIPQTTRQKPHRKYVARRADGTAGLRQIQTLQYKMGRIMVKCFNNSPLANSRVTV